MSYMETGNNNFQIFLIEIKHVYYKYLIIFKSKLDVTFFFLLLFKKNSNKIIHENKQFYIRNYYALIQCQ